MSETYKPSTPREAFVVTTCSGKEGYPSPQLAHRRLAEMKRRHVKISKKRSLTVYRCTVCHQWHLGSSQR